MKPEISGERQKDGGNPLGMFLKVLLPSHIFLEKEGVLSCTAETSRGTIGILPNRLDFVAALVPGILTCETADEGKMRYALDEGIMVKTGRNVLISVRHALEGREQRRLREAFEREWKAVEERERGVRTALAKLESGFVRRLTEIWQRG